MDVQLIRQFCYFFTAVQLSFLIELWSLCICLFWVCAILIISFITAVFREWVVPMLLFVISSFFIVAHFSVLPPASCNSAFMELFVVCVVVLIVARLQIMVANLAEL